METQKTPNIQSNFAKEEWRWMCQLSCLQTILQSYSHPDSMVLAQKQKYRLMKPVRKPVRFCVLYLHFHLLRIFLTLLLISSLTFGHWRECYLISIYSWVSQFSSCCWSPVSYHHEQKDTWRDFSLLKCAKTLCPVLESVPCASWKSVCPAALGCYVLYVAVRSIGLKYISSPTFLIHFLSG